MAMIARLASARSQAWHPAVGYRWGLSSRALGGSLLNSSVAVRWAASSGVMPRTYIFVHAPGRTTFRRVLCCFSSASWARSSHSLKVQYVADLAAEEATRDMGLI